MIIKKSLLGAALGGLLTFGAQAQVLIGVNFAGRNGGGTLAAGATAGVQPQMNFNNITQAQYSPPDNFAGATFTSPALNNSTGAATAVTFSINANDAWNSGSGTGTPNATLLNGIIKAQSNGQSVVPLTINGLLPSTAYRLNIYTTENGGGGQYSISNGATTYFQEAQDGPAFNGAFILGNNTGASRPVANYVEFNGTTSGTGSINITYTWLAGSDGVGISGFQVSQIPEPGSVALCVLGALGFVMRRRRA